MIGQRSIRLQARVAAHRMNDRGFAWHTISFLARRRWKRARTANAEEILSELARYASDQDLEERGL